MHIPTWATNEKKNQCVIDGFNKLDERDQLWNVGFLS